MGDREGGTATFIAPFPYGTIITLSRRTPQVQPINPQKKDFDPQVLEDAVDALALQVQELQRDLNRSIKVVDTDPATPMEIPVLGRMTKVLGFDKTGKFGLIPLTGEVPDEDTLAIIYAATSGVLSAANQNASALVLSEQIARVAEDSALAQRAAVLEAEFTDQGSNITEALSRITVIETTYSTKDYAEAKKSEAISASFTASQQLAGDAAATAISHADSIVATEAEARSELGRSLARTLSRMSAVMTDQAAGVEESAARIEEVRMVVANASESVATLSTNISVNYSTTSQSQSDAQVRADAAKNAAIAQAETKANLAEITAKAYADGIVDAEEARAIADAAAKAAAAETNAKNYADTKDATVLSTATAAVNNEAQARADSMTALARTLSRLTATQGDAHASVQILADALIDAAGKIIARWNLQLQAGDIITGIEALAQNGANPVSKIKILANIFEIVSSVGGASVTPFEVVEGVTKIKKAMIGEGDIDTLKIAGNSVIVPVVSRTYGPWWGPGDHTINTVRFYLPQPAAALVQSKHSIYYPNGVRAHTASLQVDDEEIDCGSGIGTHTYIPLVGVKTLGAGWHTAKVIAGIDYASYVDGCTIAAFAAMR